MTDEARKAYRGRTSPQREAIAGLAEAMPGAFSAEDLIAEARRRGVAVGVATVYRSLAAMEAAGWIEAVATRDGATLYARCRGEGHHHHLVCESCGRVEEAPCALGEALARVSAGCGFELTRHELTLYGRCASCAEEGR
jgi:Fur family ferric uptake transcriptional regulator